jgi:hypothetical protein
MSPRDMVRLGRFDRLRKHIVSAVMDRVGSSAASIEQRQVGKSRKQEPPRTNSRALITDSRPCLLELDRFSNVDMMRWKRMSDDLDEINDLFYYGLEPQRQRRHQVLIGALQHVAPAQFAFSRWTRLVTWRYSIAPLQQPEALPIMAIASTSPTSPAVHRAH